MMRALPAAVGIAQGDEEIAPAASQPPHPQPRLSRSVYQRRFHVLSLPGLLLTVQRVRVRVRVCLTADKNIKAFNI